MTQALEARFTAPVASFRDPLYSGVQKCLPCPSPSTIGGMLAAAAGGWEYVDPGTRFAAAFRAGGEGIDVETWHPVNDKGQRLDAQPRDRDFLADVELRVWFTSDLEVWWRRLRRPVWGLSLGRSQDLVGVTLRHTTLEKTSDAVIGHAIVPSGQAVGNVRMTTAVSMDRTAMQWDGYWYYPQGGTMNLGECDVAADGQAVVALPPVHPWQLEPVNA